MKFSPAWISFLGAFVLGPNAYSATIVGQSGFEGDATYDNGYFYTYVFNYSGYGNGGPNIELANKVGVAVNQVAGVGVGGSGALKFTIDGSAVPQAGQNYPTPSDPPVQYSYYGGGIGGGLAIKTPMTSPNVGDYTFMLDLKAAGLQTPTFKIEFELEFQAPDNTIGTDGDTASDIVLKLLYDGASSFLVGSDFATFSIDVDGYTGIQAGSLATFSQYSSFINNVNINLIFREGITELGFDANNSLFIDNATLLQVPEPTGISMMVLAGVGLLVRRRRG